MPNCETFIKGDIVTLKSLLFSEEANLQGTDFRKLYDQKRGKLGLIVQTGFEYIDVVFDSDKLISRVPYRYLRRVYRPLPAESTLVIAPGDVIKLNESAITVDYITIQPIYFDNMVMYYKITVFFDNGAANDILSIPFTLITKGPRETKTYVEFDSLKALATSPAYHHISKWLLNSYYGIHSFKDKKPDSYQCEKPIGKGYGFNHAMIYSEPYTIDKNEPDKMHSIIKEMPKMKKSAKKSVYYPIKKVIFNPPATIVFWENGSKTVVKAQGEAFDPEKGLAMAISRHYLCDICNLTRFDGVFKKYLTKETKEK
uniref:Uncharacterized protein n=1 Tax=Siphoviridae sp. ctWT735 TaxID=2825538 RepID=A0A8S5TU67_9CAUD|nr:MAG TPA: hypothetical protein [Siphoviridae sp. ctWT735]